MTGQIIFDPLLSWSIIVGAGLLALALVAFATWRRLSGWWLRALALAALVGALANPSLQIEDRQSLSDIVIAIVDETASQRIGDRSDQAARALAALEAQVAARGNTDIRVIRLDDGAGNAGTELMSALAQALAEEPRARVAGAMLITDGQAHDIERAPQMPAPLHVLLSGHADDWDRRLIVKNAPGFTIIGEEVDLTLRIEDQGAVPEGLGVGSLTRLMVSVDGGPAQSLDLPVGRDVSVPVTLDHGGMNVIQFTLAEAVGELTDRNNSAIIQINGVRDRLRVLLVSGQPHPGERTWRNLLKSDSSVDLVHFTILRPPEKQDGVPVTELSLIAFPTRELFLEKIHEFDLIIFDRYKRRGILPAIYLQNVNQYVQDGGAVLVAAGPDFATADSLFRSPLGLVLPAAPTSFVLEDGYRPVISDVGRRHPVTQGLEAFAPTGGWGRWFRLIDLAAPKGHVVMAGADERPLLVLNRVGEGRVALLASDHAWLWSRGFEGGGPQLELLRRLAHWMMKEPELEEEALTAQAEGQTVTITRRTMAEEVGEVTVTGPDGRVTVLPLNADVPGRYQAQFEASDLGLYRISEGGMAGVVAVGPAAPREFEETVASADKLSPLVAETRGGVMPISADLPDLRTVRPGRPATGRGWIGITPREAYLTRDVSVLPLLPAWVALALIASLMIGAWLIEGRRSA